MIKIEKLVKTYKRRSSKKNSKYEIIKAVDNINLNIKKGEIFGLIGPNGAGKTTTLKILSTLIIPDEGKITINGYDVIKDADMVRGNVGLLTGEFTRSLYWRLTGLQNMKFFGKLKGIWDPDDRINELLELFDLDKIKNERIMKYSTGNKHKIALAVGLLNNPPVVFLDEPLTGIDPVTAYEIKNLVRNKFNDKTIIWASHNLYEVEEMCNRIALINNGRIILEGEPEQLGKNRWDHTKIRIVTNKPKEFSFFKNVDIQDKFVEIKTNDVITTIEEIMSLAKSKKIDIIEIKTMKLSLEDIFMEEVKNV